MTLQEQVDELLKLAPLEGTEYADLWHHLIGLYEGYESYMSKDFFQCLLREIMYQHEFAKTLDLE